MAGFAGFVNLTLLLALVSLMILEKRSPQSSGYRLRKRSARARRNYLHRRREWEASLDKTKDNSGISESLTNLIRSYIGDKFGAQHAGLTLKDVEQILGDNGINQEQRLATRGLWEELDMLAYGQASVNLQKAKDLADQADSLIGAIDKQC